MRGQEHNLLAVGEIGRDQFVSLLDADGVDAVRAHVGEILELGLFHQAVAGGEEDVLAHFFEMANGEHGADRLARLQTDQVADVLAFAGGADVGNFVHLQPVDASGVGEDQNVGVRGVDEEMLDEILVARLHAGAARASAALHAVGGDRRALHVAAVADRDCDLLVGDQVFQMDFRSFVFDDGAALVSVEFLYFFEFFHDHGAQLLFRTQNGFVLGDVLTRDIQFFRDFVDGELGQAVQLQFENRVSLNSGERLFRIALGSRGP